MRNLSVENTLFLYKNNFIRTKPLVLEKKTYKQTKNKARFVVPQNRNKVSRLVFLKITESDCRLYCNAFRLVLLSHLNTAKLFNDHILFHMVSI